MSSPDERLAYLGLGGNLGDPVGAMAAALRMIDADAGTRVDAVSSVYRTPPWGKLDQPDFLNCAAAVLTHRSPRELLDLCLETERRLKRVRAERWGPRTVDLDVLTYGDAAIHEPGLAVPHPRMAERAFVMVPLAEIAPALDVGGQAASRRVAAMDTSGIMRLDLPSDWWRN